MSQRMRPCELDALVDIHCRGDYRGCMKTSETYGSSIKHLFNRGLIREAKNPDIEPYALTDRGHFFLEMVLSTPDPIEVTKFADPRDES